MIIYEQRAGTFTKTLGLVPTLDQGKKKLLMLLYLEKIPWSYSQLVAGNRCVFN
jgi:hypothetical protein